MRKVACILGSPRANGNTATILAEIHRALDDGETEISSHQLSSLDIGYCCGCKACYITGQCVQNDDVEKIVEDIFASDLVIVASPSYWGDITGQMKVFIDRCTPYCNNNSSRKAVSSTAKGVAIAIRAGQNKAENLHLVNTIEHFLGHLGIPLISSFTVEGIDTPADLAQCPEILADAYSFGEKLNQK